MERGKITINENGVKIIPVNGNVWLSAWGIAKLFDVFPAKVNANIKAIFKSEVLHESEVSYCERYANGDSVDLYSLEMITALAFRIHSPNADKFRAWLIKRACSQSFFPMEQLFDERKISLN